MKAVHFSLGFIFVLSLGFLFVLDIVLYSVSGSQTYYTDENDLEVLTLLPLTSARIRIKFIFHSSYIRACVNTLF